MKPENKRVEPDNKECKDWQHASLRDLEDWQKRFDLRDER